MLVPDRRSGVGASRARETSGARAVSELDFIVCTYLRMHSDALVRAKLREDKKIPEQHIAVLELLRKGARTMFEEHLTKLEIRDFRQFDNRNSYARLQITINRAASRLRSHYFEQPNPTHGETALAFQALSTDVLAPHFRLSPGQAI